MIARRTIAASYRLLLVLTLSSCDEGSPFIPPVGTGYIWPLEIGNTWVWSVQRYDSAGAVIESYVDSSVVTDTLTFMGSRWHRIQGYTDGYVRNGGDGFRFGHPGSPEFLYLKFPASIGDTVMYGSSQTIVLKSKSAPVMVKGQTHESYHYEIVSTGPTSHFTHEYLVPNIGRVLLTGTDSTGTLVNYRVTLIEYLLQQVNPSRP